MRGGEIGEGRRATAADGSIRGMHNLSAALEEKSGKGEMSERVSPKGLGL